MSPKSRFFCSVVVWHQVSGRCFSGIFPRGNKCALVLCNSPHNTPVWQLHNKSRAKRADKQPLFFDIFGKSSKQKIRRKKKWKSEKNKVLERHIITHRDTSSAIRVDTKLHGVLPPTGRKGTTERVQTLSIQLSLSSSILKKRQKKNHNRRFFPSDKLTEPHLK